jgi:hypothetical protein
MKPDFTISHSRMEKSPQNVQKYKSWDLGKQCGDLETKEHINKGKCTNDSLFSPM